MSNVIEAAVMASSDIGLTDGPMQLKSAGIEAKSQVPCTEVTYYSNLGYTVAKPDGQKYEVMEFIEKYVPLEDRTPLINHCRAQLIKRTSELGYLSYESKVEVGIRARLRDAFNKKAEHDQEELLRIQDAQAKKYFPIVVVVFIVICVIAHFVDCSHRS